MAGLVQIRGRASAHPYGGTAAPDASGAQSRALSENLADVQGGTALPSSAGEGVRVYVETFGCQMNEADSALILGQLAAAGYQGVKDVSTADVILINTCAVREKAEERVWGRASQLLDYRTQRPDLVIGITGCMAEHLRDKIATKAPHVRVVAGPDSYRRIAELVTRARAGESVIDVALDKAEVYDGLNAIADDDHVGGFVTIQRGCDKFCTFCVVPFTRGRERGVAPGEVLRLVGELARKGYREVSLLGQTVNSYHWESVDFAQLLRAVCRVEGIERVRFTSPYPLDFGAALIDCIASEPKVMPFVHLPVQSGSNQVLEQMRRGYSREAYLDIVARLRAAVPGIAISTDLMVGFCGESEAQFEETLALVREVRFESAFMFAYSDRGITYAAKKLEDDVPGHIKQQRLARLIELQRQQMGASLEARVGTEIEVLVSGPSKRRDHLLGKTRHFENALLPLDCAKPGDFVRARVRRTSGHSLFATPVSVASQPHDMPLPSALGLKAAAARADAGAFSSNP